MTEKICPCSTRKSTLLTAVNPPNRIVSCRTSSRGTIPLFAFHSAGIVIPLALIRDPASGARRAKRGSRRRRRDGDGGQPSAPCGAALASRVGLRRTGPLPSLVPPHCGLNLLAAPERFLPAETALPG